MRLLARLERTGMTYRASSTLHSRARNALRDCQVKKGEPSCPSRTTQYPPLPPDDLKRTLTTARPDTDQTLPHIGLVGDTYTITVSGEDTAGRFCVIDMHIPPGGGPATASA